MWHEHQRVVVNEGRARMEHPAGEADDGSLRVDFDRRLKLEFHGSRITSDAGLLAYREPDDALGLSDLASAALSECRRGKNTRHLLTGLLRLQVPHWPEPPARKTRRQ
jgi:hypothetical protein